MKKIEEWTYVARCERGEGAEFWPNWAVLAVFGEVPERYEDLPEFLTRIDKEEMGQAREEMRRLIETHMELMEEHIETGRERQRKIASCDEDLLMEVVAKMKGEVN